STVMRSHRSATTETLCSTMSTVRPRAVLMVEHNLSVVADLCDRITVLARGEVLAEGDYATVSKDPRVVEAYLGHGHAGQRKHHTAAAAAPDHG
ncbi:MAG: hypothetical protein EOP93_23170, partial [Lysobacteraceae bacterium]